MPGVVGADTPESSHRIFATSRRADWRAEPRGETSRCEGESTSGGRRSAALADAGVVSPDWSSARPAIG